MSFFNKNNYSKDYRQTALDTTDSDHGWYLCAHCGRKFRKADMDADHIIPKSLGGSNNPRNLQLLCSHCNRSKGNKTSLTLIDSLRRQVDYAQYSNYKNNRAKVEEECNRIKKNLRNYSVNQLKKMYNDNTYSSIRYHIKNELARRGVK